MKLFEIISVLTENKAEHIAKQQYKKIAMSMKMDSSFDSNLVRDAAANDMTEEFVAKTLNNIANTHPLLKKHLQWVVNKYIKNSFMLNEDLPNIAEALEIYEQWKTDIGPINNFTLVELYKAVKKYKQLNVDSEKERNLISSGQAEVVYSQGNERIIIPGTYAASEYFAKEKWGTEWCTKAKNMYEEYTEDGPLYMIEINDGEEVYQVHWESNQIMDRNDSEANPKHSKAFQWLIEKRKKEIENDKTGNPSEAAYWMVEDGNADSKWAKKVIENAKSGDPSYSAHEMVRNGHADSKWAKKVIENDKIGYPSDAAYWMVREGHADSKWAIKVIESDKSGEPIDAAYWMVEDGYADKNWYEKVTGKKFK